MNIKGKTNKVAEAILLSATFFLLFFFFSSPLLAFDAIEAEKKTEEIIEKYLGKEVPGLAIALVKDGEILFSKAYGYADLEKKIPVIAEETVFEYGSINKLFVWISLMQMAEQGLLDLEEDIALYLPEQLKKELISDQSFSLIDLMNHSAGFEDPLFDFANKKMLSLPSLDKVLQRNIPSRIFKSGEVMSYSNYGAALAAYIIERVSGMDFFDYERENIFLAAQMFNIAGHPLYIYNPRLLPRKARGYNVQRDLFEDAGWVYVPAYPSGAADGTVTALAKFALALTPEEAEDCPFFTSGQYYEKLFKQTYQSDQLTSTVSHGFWEYNGQIKSYGHGGNTAGFSSHFAVSPEERLGLVVLTNSGSENDLLFELHEAVFLPFDDQLAHLETISSPGAASLEGKYLMTRAAFSNFMEFFFYLSPSQVKVLDESRIQLKIPGHEASYRQVAPYKYVIEDYSSLLIKYSYPELYFDVGAEGPKKISSGNAPDLIPYETFRSEGWVSFSLIFFFFPAIFFLINPFILLNYRLKKDIPINKYLQVLNFLGLLLLLSLAALIYRAFKYMYFSSKWVLPFLCVNQGLSLSVLFLSGIIFLQRKKVFKSKFYWYNFQAYFISMLVFIYLLYDWNFLKLI